MLTHPRPVITFSEDEGPLDSSEELNASTAHDRHGNVCDTPAAGVCVASRRSNGRPFSPGRDTEFAEGRICQWRKPDASQGSFQAAIVGRSAPAAAKSHDCRTKTVYRRLPSSHARAGDD